MDSRTKKHLDKLLVEAKNLEKIGYATRFIDYYEEHGENVKEYKDEIIRRISLLSMFNYN